MVASHSAEPVDFTGAPSRTKGTLADDVAEQSADMGVMVDEAEVTVQEAPGVGFVAATAESLDSVTSVDVKESEVREDDQLIAEDFEYGLETNSGAADYVATRRR